MYLLVPEYVKDLIIYERNKYLKMPPLLRINAEKAAILGDTHGAINVTYEGSKYLKEGYMVILLGDLVDRGKDSLLNLIFALEMSFLSENFLIIRGNHESSLTTPYYGFLDELKENEIDYLYDTFLTFFASLPPVALINEKIICLHGGIPSGEVYLSDLEKLPRDDFEPTNKILFEILWNDPREYIEGFLTNTRGEGTYFFGKDAFNKFMINNKLDYLIRGHEVKMEGISYNFDKKLITVFSSEYHNGKKGILLIENGNFREIKL